MRAISACHAANRLETARLEEAMCAWPPYRKCPLILHTIAYIPALGVMPRRRTLALGLAKS